MLFMLISTTSAAQQGSSELFDVHFDKAFYLTGETIWYKIYNSNFHQVEDPSELVYLNIHDENADLIQQQIHPLQNGAGHGQFNIPLDWDEDYYFVSCFTRSSLHSGAPVQVKAIPIYNIFHNEDQIEDAPLQIEDSKKNSIRKQKIEIVLDQKSFLRRSKGRFRLRSDFDGNCSVVIKRKGIDSLHAIHYDEKRIEFHYDTNSATSRVKGLILAGQITDPNTKAPVHSDVLMLYQNGTNRFLRMATSDGSINSVLTPFYGNSDFQLFNMNPFQSDVVEFRRQIQGQKLLGISSKLTASTRSPQMNEYIQNERLNNNLREIFRATGIDSLKSKSLVPVELVADKTYDISKFQALKSFGEFLKEIVVFAELLTKKDISTIKLKNTETQRFFMEDPWYLVDGYLTRNQEEVLKIQFSNLVRVDLFITNESILKQLDPVMIRSGLIAIYTNNLAYRNVIDQRSIIEVGGFAPVESFSTIRPARQKEIREQPNFESLLYWNPNIDLSSNHSYDFVTSDLIGDFEVEVNGYTSNGERLTGSQSLKVKY